MSSFKTLPEFLNKKDDKGQPVTNYVTVTNNVRQPKVNDQPQPLEIKFEAKLIEVPQFDTIDEFVSDCGSVEKALEVLNDLTEKAAASAAKAKIRTATSGTVEQIIESGKTAAREFTWRETETLSAKEVKSQVENIAAQIAAGALTPEQVAQLVRKLAGK